MNNSIHMIRLCLFILSTVSITASFSQEKDKWEEGEGGIKDVEIQIIKNKEITLPVANRNFEKVPPRPADANKQEMTYDVKTLNFNTPDFSPLIRPLKLKDVPLTKTYGNYLSAGLGNYSAAFLEGYVNTKRDKNKFYGAHVYHQSFGKGPVDGKVSASGNTNVDLFGKFFNEKVTTGASLNYENRMGYFYGYPAAINVERDNIRQSYHVVGLGGSIENTRSGGFNFKLNGGFSYLTDHYAAKESDLTLSWKSDNKMDEKSAIVVSADYYLISRKDSLVDATPRHLFKIAPGYRFIPIEGLRVLAGINVAYENDKNDDKSLHLYPNVWADYELSKSVQAYAGLTGDMDKVSLHTLSKENMWLDANIDIFHTNQAVDLTAGVKGKVVKNMAFEAGFSVARLKNLYYYQNVLIAPLDQSKFEVRYEDTNRVDLFVDLGLSITDKIRFNGRGDYYSYSSDVLLHRPTYKLALGTSINIYQKITLQGDFVAQGGMKAFDNLTSKMLTLDPALDLNAKINYFLSKQFTVFAKFNNILSTDYPLYYNYPVRGFQAMGGVTWSF